MAEARSARRRRKLEQIEIPEDHVVVTDELLGKGGFGDVFLADLNGRNAAAKVLSPFHLPPGRGHSCEPRRPVSGDHMLCLGGRSSVETWLVDFGNPKKLAAFLRGCRYHDLVKHSLH